MKITYKIVNTFFGKHSEATYRNYLDEILESKNAAETNTVQEIYDKIESSIKEAVEAENEKHKNITKKTISSKISENTKALIAKRGELHRIIYMDKAQEKRGNMR